MPKKYFRNFKQSPLVVKDKTPKANRKSTFRQLAGAKKYECKALTEYLLLRWESDYQLN